MAKGKASNVISSVDRIAGGVPVRQRMGRASQKTLDGRTYDDLLKELKDGVVWLEYPTHFDTSKDGIQLKSMALRFKNGIERIGEEIRVSAREYPKGTEFRTEDGETSVTGCDFIQLELRS